MTTALKAQGNVLSFRTKDTKGQACEELRCSTLLRPHSREHQHPNEGTFPYRCRAACRSQDPFMSHL